MDEPVDHGAVAKGSTCRLRELCLEARIGHDDPAASDVLHLAEPEALATEFLDDRRSRLSRARRRGCAERCEHPDHFLARCTERPSVLVEFTKVRFLGVAGP